MKQLRIAGMIAFFQIFIGPLAALEVISYDVDAYSDILAQNNVVILDFHASWCPTCAAQKKVFTDFEQSGRFPSVTLVQIDFDEEGALKEQWNVQHQSTLIRLENGVETDRSMGVTDADALADFIGVTAEEDGLEIVSYDADSFGYIRESTPTVILGFHASWCPTCKTQRRVFSRIEEQGDISGVTVVQADYDEETDLKKEWNVQRQSTLIRLENGEETDRVIGSTDEADIRAFITGNRE
jgi:thiol-disulfide isomerase/thioredoxin